MLAMADVLLGVTLRDVRQGDLPVFFEHQLDPEATRMAAFEARDQDAFTAHWSKVLGDDAIDKKTILVDGQVAGNVVSWEQDGRREVGYWIGRKYWGGGVATRALSKFLDLVKTRPLYAHVAKHNAASIRVLEKCGFTVVGSDVAHDKAPDGAIAEYIMELRNHPPSEQNPRL
jgi:RimJ/RimL family protein N-acetyltransferase